MKEVRKWRKMEKRFCPRCRSNNVKINITPTLAVGMPQDWICEDCGYSNVVFPVMKKIKLNIKK